MSEHIAQVHTLQKRWNYVRAKGSFHGSNVQDNRQRPVASNWRPALRKYWEKLDKQYVDVLIITHPLGVLCIWWQRLRSSSGKQHRLHRVSGLESYRLTLRYVGTLCCLEARILGRNHGRVSDSPAIIMHGHSDRTYQNIVVVENVSQTSVTRNEAKLHIHTYLIACAKQKKTHALQIICFRLQAGCGLCSDLRRAFTQQKEKPE